MNCREVFCALGSAAVSAWPALAQTSSKVVRVGHINSAPMLVLASPLGGVLIRSFQQRGYLVDKNLVLELRGAAGPIRDVAETGAGTRGR